jgi:tetratricopeptide (TPR) repeat protein
MLKLLTGALIALCIWLAYANSFAGRFVMDDEPSITNNATLRRVQGWSEVFAPPMNSTVGGRPVTNLTLAINYAVDGVNPRGYHLVNLLIHIGAALCLFGILGRTLLLSRWPDVWRAAALPLAATVCLLWALHPLQTESVTYVVQRVESLVGFFYLLTLYAGIRAMENGSRVWTAIACVACWLGMGSKEVMVSAPLFVLFYDRTLVAGTFREAFVRRRFLYAGLFSSWFLLAGLLSVYGEHSGSTGFEAGVEPWHYLLTQCRAIVMYLRLTFWPDPLVFDYWRAVVRGVSAVWPQMILLVVLAMGTAWLCWKRSWVGLAGLWFFAILAPSSSFVPVATQTMAEHRMYLPLAAVVVLVVVTGYRWFGSKSWWLFAMIAVTLGVATHVRNRVYHSEIALWQDTVEKVPNNARALTNLGNALTETGRAEEALPLFARAMEILKGRDADLFNNRGVALLKLGRVAEAEADFREALRLDPKHVKALNSLGYSLLTRGQVDEAEAVISQVTAIDAMEINAINNLGFVALKRGQDEKARGQFEKALGIMPDNAMALTNLGNIELRRGALAEAMAYYRRAVGGNPTHALAWYGLGNAAYAAGRWSEAVEGFERSIRYDPQSADTHNNLGGAYVQLRRVPEALKAYTRAIELSPGLVNARKSRATLLAQNGQLPQAVQEFEAVLGLAPNDVELLGNLGLAYQMTQQPDKAKRAYEKALELSPANAAIRERLKVLNAGSQK